MQRIFWIVLDSVGIGGAADAADFGDADANTLRRLTEVPGFAIPNLEKAGIGNIPGVSFLPPTREPEAAFGRLTEASAGKDTTVGHFEMAGVISDRPFPTYPQGFPPEVLTPFREVTGRGILCNRPYSGTDVIRDYGAEHLRTGDLIVYTSADSVFQIAAHEKILPRETLYAYCRSARRILTGEHAVARVIARPFAGTEGKFFRTDGRRDFALEPPGVTVLDLLQRAGKDVIAVGKISDIYAGRGITEKIPSHNNEEGMAAAMTLLHRDFQGLSFINLVDFDMLYGHRNDKVGYANALMAFDRFLPGFLAGMRPEDALIVTADHGCDPGDISTDHTREDVPLLIFGKTVRPVSLGVRRGFYHIGKTVAALLGVPAPALPGEDLSPLFL